MRVKGGRQDTVDQDVNKGKIADVVLTVSLVSVIEQQVVDNFTGAVEFLPGLLYSYARSRHEPQQTLVCLLARTEESRRLGFRPSCVDCTLMVATSSFSSSPPPPPFARYRLGDAASGAVEPAAHDFPAAAPDAPLDARYAARGRITRALLGLARQLGASLYPAHSRQQRISHWQYWHA